MAIDRASRRQHAERVAAYLRGELRAEDVLEAAKHEREQAARTVDGDRALYHASLGGFVVGARPTAKQWDSVLRDLAFLLSDFELHQEKLPPTPDYGVRTLLLAAAFVMLVAACCYLLTGPTLWVVVMTLYSGFPAAVVAAHVGGESEPKPELEGPFAPFPDRESWEEHRPLLDQLRLPTYEQLLANPPKPLEHKQSRIWTWTLNVLGVLTFVCILLPLAAVAWTAVALCSPFLVIRKFIPRPRTRRILKLAQS